MTCLDIRIDSDVPMPRPAGRVRNPLPFDKLSIGDSFAVPIAKRNAVLYQMTMLHRKGGRVRYATRVWENKSQIRVWRVK